MNTRDKMVGLFEQYLGAQKGDDRQRFLVDVYNLIVPLPRATRMQYSWEYCACAVSAIAKMNQIKDFPFEIGCWEMMQTAKQMGIWHTTGVPQKADLILFDWNNDKAPDHVAMVREVNGNIAYTIEGNIDGGKVEYAERNLKENAILGFITPKYEEIPVYTEMRVKTALYLRQKPNGKVLAVMKKGTIVQWAGEAEDKWYKVLCGDKEGWCSSKYLEVVK